MSRKTELTYEREILETLYRLERENGHIRAFSPFTDLARQWFDRERRHSLRPRVAVLGPGLPAELILAAGAAPFYILGGSLRAGDWSDDLLPRDTDPVSRSLLGLILDPEGPDFSDTLFLVPASSDSMRKIAFLLKEQGRRVHVVDIPPRRSDLLSEEKWQNQMGAMTLSVARHTGTRLTVSRIQAAMDTVDAARRALSRTLRLTRGREDLLSGAARLLLQNSLYYADDLPAWTRNLLRLHEELRTRPRDYRTPDRPGVLLMGSPVYFPNYKLPFLLEDLGLRLLSNLDVTSMTLDMPALLPGWHRGREALIRAAADRWYCRDGSPAYAVNERLQQEAVGLLRETGAEGVIFHVLKGQIEYDFELERLEPILDRAGIPLIRLETDYQYQDVEQLRIRLEAFSEMLSRNRRREERRA